MDEEIENVQVVSSMCMNCHKTGTSTLFPTNIPFYRNIVVYSFECPHCGHTARSVDDANEVMPQGHRITLKVNSVNDFDRTLVRTGSASIIIPELEFEIPATQNRGSCTTVESILSTAIAEIDAAQAQRRTEMPDVASKIDEFLDRMRLCVSRGADFLPYTLIIDDPSGSSHIENLCAPQIDPQLGYESYDRTEEQNEKLEYLPGISGLAGTEKTQGADLPKELKTSKAWNLSEPLDPTNNIDHVSFETPCPSCGADGKEKMCEIEIPGFQKCWIMSFVCDYCGERSNNIRPSGAYGEKGRKWTLNVETVDDLSRDVLKSDSAGIKVPAIDFELHHGSLGGLFTTVEGLFTKLADELNEKFPFTGDSQLLERREKIDSLISALRGFAAGENLPCVIEIDDPADNSHIGRRYGELLFLTKAAMAGDQVDTSADSGKPDAQLSYEFYERTDEHNDFLGLKDMVIEDY